MMRKNTLIKSLRNVPWLLVSIVFIWIIVFIMMGDRYLVFQNEATNKYLKPERSVESIIVGESNSLNFTDSYFGIDPRAASPANRPITIFDPSKPDERINLSQQVLYTTYGELHAIFDRNTGRYTLFFNQLPLSEISNPVIIHKFELNNKQLVFIFDARIVAGDWIYSILDIGPKHKQLFNEVGNYEKLIGSGVIVPGSCIYLKFIDARKYTESGNYQVFNYCGNSNPYKVLDVKPEIYYQTKFSHYNARQVVKFALKNHCLDTNKGELILNHKCNYGATYCYMYRALSPAPNDRYYNLLSYACGGLTNRIRYVGIID